MPADQDAYDQLSAYTWTLGDPEFIHQHVVDAFAAQHARAEDKPIRVAFALVGLCLHLEHGATGKQVQRAHTRLARKRRQWPVVAPPADRGRMTAADVLAAEPGVARARALDAWCGSVWGAWAASHEAVAGLLHDCDELPTTWAAGAAATGRART